jgi:hypothetical protein
VPICGERVRVALMLAGISNIQAARRISRTVPVSSQAIDNIVNRRTRHTKPEIRNHLARLCGPAITARFLGGEEELKIPPMPRIGVSGGAPTFFGGVDSQDLLGEDFLPLNAPGVGAGVPPVYEIAALSLYRRIEQVWKVEYPADSLPTDLYPMLRQLLSLTHWQRLAFKGGESLSPSHLRRHWADAGDFARAMDTALFLILKPWVKGDAVPRKVLAASLRHLIRASWKLREDFHRRETLPHYYLLRRHLPREQRREHSRRAGELVDLISRKKAAARARR